MTGQPAAAEPYATRFESEVTAVDGRRVWLDSTYFFAASGGQPADRGRIGDARVADVRLEAGEPVHVLETEPSFRDGQRVLCSIDWGWRMYCMRAHTASHLLGGAARREFGSVTDRGIEITEDHVRLQLDVDRRVTDEDLVTLDKRVNRAVWESRPVSWDSMPLADASDDESIVVPVSVEDAAIEKGRVRVVTIEDADARRTNDGTSTNGVVDGVWDATACGGTHVRNTREIGPVTVLGMTETSSNGIGIDLAVGPRAIERRETEKRVTFAASRQLGVPLSEATGELSRLEAERTELADVVDLLRRELVTTRIENAGSFERDGKRWIATTVDGVDADEAGSIARESVGARADVVVVAGDDPSPFAVVAADADVDAMAILSEITAEFGGGGGGTADLAWGGDFDVEPDRVIAAVRNEPDPDGKTDKRAST